MTQIYGGPLDRANGDARTESDVIFTATALGFALTRAIHAQPFSFDVAHDANSAGLARIKAVTRALLAIVDTSPALRRGQAGESVAWGRSPGHGGPSDNVVTGRVGGDYLTPEQRNRPLGDSAAKKMATWEYDSASPNNQSHPGQYHGRGAYTGILDDPLGAHTLIVPTVRRVIRDPRRWSPVPEDIWGLIGSNNQGGVSGPNVSEDPRKGMGPLDRAAGIVQYTHGMISAMREAQRWGPWTTPYEIAVGEQTTKRASCFACSTYMWANGYPASSTHLGSCESWGTLPDGTLEDEDYVFSAQAEGELDRALARQMNNRWHAQMYHMLRAGTALMESNRGAVDPGHHAALDLLVARTDHWDPVQVLTGGNLFLDAISFHRPDTDRIGDTLAPAIARLSDA